VNPVKIYATTDGFDQRMSAQGILGNGVYFSKTATYSANGYGYNIGTDLTAANPKLAVPLVVSSSVTPAPKPSKAKSAKSKKASQYMGKIVSTAHTVQQLLVASIAAGSVYKYVAPNQNSYSQYRYIHGRPPVQPLTCKACKKEVLLDDTLLCRHLAAVSTLAQSSLDTPTLAPTLAPTPTPPTPPTTRARKRSHQDMEEAVASAPAVVATKPFDPDHVRCTSCDAVVAPVDRVLHRVHRYDSVSKHDMIAVYDSAQAVPTHLVTFSAL
jgi:hypothetical protein